MHLKLCTTNMYSKRKMKCIVYFSKQTLTSHIYIVHVTGNFCITLVAVENIEQSADDALQLFQ